MILPAALAGLIMTRRVLLSKSAPDRATPPEREATYEQPCMSNPVRPKSPI